MIVVASATMAALGLGAPAALAAEPVYDCSFDAFRLNDATGNNYEGQTSGFAADSDGDAVSIRCYITVNGVEVGAEASGGGTGFTAATGPISFSATRDDDIDICADVNGVFAECFQGEHSQFPPQETIDAISGVRQLIDDLTSPGGPIFCTLLQEFGGHYPPDIWIDPGDGDVYRNGTRVVDCPPYGDDDGDIPTVAYVSSH